MNLPKKISPDNLVETIVEVRMTSQCSPALWAGMISVRMHALGYDYIPAPQLSVSLDKSGKLDVSLERVKEATYGIFRKGAIRFVMQDESLSFNCTLGNYVGWELYQKEIRDVLVALKSCEVAEAFNRVQLRYISEYRDVDIIDCIDGSICIGGTTNLFESQEIKLKRTEGAVKVFVSLVNNAKRSSPTDGVYSASLFDVNVYENFKSSSSIETVMSLLDNVHTIEKETFFGLLKEDFVKTLNPQYA